MAQPLNKHARLEIKAPEHVIEAMRAPSKEDVEQLAPHGLHPLSVTFCAPRRITRLLLPVLSTVAPVP